MPVKLKKIADNLSIDAHLATAEAMRAGEFDGLSISYLGEAFGPVWSDVKDYDLSFLRHYEGLRALEIFLPELTNLEAIAKYVPDITFLSVGECNKASLSLAPLASLSQLSSLSLVRNKRDFEVITQLAGITDLRLTGYQAAQVNRVADIPNLEHLHIGFGTLESLAMLEGLSALKTLDITWVKKLQDVSAIAQLAALETLSLSTLKQVSCLPEMAHLNALRAVYLDTMNGLSSLSGLQQSSLKELIVLNSKITPAVVAELAGCLPALERVLVFLDRQSTTDTALRAFNPKQICSAFDELKHYVSPRTRIQYC